MAETTSSRLEKIFEDAIKELEKERKTTRQKGLREGSVDAQRRPLLDELDRSERYLLDYEESLKAAEKRGEDSRKKARSLTNTLKQAEAWYRDAQFTARGAEEQDALLRDWNDAARSIFGVGLVDEPTLAETLVSGKRLDVPLQEIFEGFREEIASLEDQISEQETFVADASDEIAAIEKDIRDTQRDVESINYDLDRVVIKVNDYSLYEELGSTGKSPRWAVAFKYEAEQAQTVIKNISVQVGRTGVLTPVAEFEPVFLAGSTVRFASLHNWDEIRSKDIRIGDHVKIEKAGDIIPQVVTVLTDLRESELDEFDSPKTCPACDRTVNQLEGEVAFRCQNEQCVAKLLGKLKHFVSAL